MDTTKTITHISLCAGYGGIDIGLKRAIPNLRTICFSEIEAFPIANLVSKMEKGYLDTAPIWTDIKTFPWKEFRGVVDIVSGGFPCQPFSAAGKRNADTDERHLFPYILQGIRECQPSLVFLENVEGIISSKLSGDGWSDPAGTPVLLHVLRELERVGYKATAGIFSASEVGAPHQRKRVFIMGYSEHNGLPTLEKLRGNEATSSKRRQEEQAETRQLTGTSRPTNVSGLSGSECGSKLAYNDSNGSGQSRLLRQGADGSVAISNGESWGVELAHGKNERCGGRSDRDGNDSRGISEQETQLKSVLRSEVEGCCGDTRKTLWPSRPGQPQFGWEPPRVVANTNSRRLEGAEEVGGRAINAMWSCGETPKVGNTSSIRLECPRDEGGLAEEGRRTKGKGSKSTSTSEESSHTSINKATINEIKSSVGRDITRSSSRMVLTELYTTSDSRNDELRLLGNGVVPQTCTKAFIILFDKLMNEGKIKEEQGTLNI